ncbi:MAG: hypothetical protein DWQ08_12670, partial [Proteobacteria bacterium]
MRTSFTDVRYLTMEKSVDRHIFILGRGRSGTTLLQRMLNQAAGVTLCGEHNGFLTGVAEAYDRQLKK